MNYNVFTDFHHASLLQSLILLFEKRLGGKVYRPIGMEWANQGFWKVYDHPETQAQFLGIGAATPDNTPKLNEVDGMAWKKDEYPGDPYVYFCRDIDSGNFNNAITFDGFMKTDIDIVIASIPQHVEPFRRLCELHPNKPKLIYQIGNDFGYIDTSLVKNIMLSAKINDQMQIGADVNVISYHQEFDTGKFYPHFPHPEYVGSAHCKCMFHEPGYKVSSYVNLFGIQEHLTADYAQFLEVEQQMRNGWMFRAYGGQCRDGAIGPSAELAESMRHSRFIWHTKQGGDGYGHVIHNIPAVARPMIVKKEYYKDKLAEPLLIDGETCICIDGLDSASIVNKIEYFNDPARYFTMCRAAYNNFTKIVDFDKEAVMLQEFFERLV